MHLTFTVKNTIRLMNLKLVLNIKQEDSMVLKSFGAYLLLGGRNRPSNLSQQNIPIT